MHFVSSVAVFYACHKFYEKMFYLKMIDKKFPIINMTP